MNGFAKAGKRLKRAIIKKTIKTNLLACIVSVSVAYLSWGAESTIFTWEENSPQVRSKLEGTLRDNNWYAKSVTWDDLKFHQELFGNAQVMGCFADGQVRKPDHTEGRIKLWVGRFEAGQPHGGMTVFDAESKKPIGHVVAGGGDGPGVAEVAYAYVREVWGKGIGSNVVQQIVTKWAPEVRQTGLGQSNPEKSKIFQCFGEKALERLDATASPSNPGSWKILVKNNFQKAETGTSMDRVVIEVDPDQCRKSDKVDYQVMEEYILQRYFNKDEGLCLEEGVRYVMTDPDGKEMTLSKHRGYNRLKYHFEYYLPE